MMFVRRSGRLNPNCFSKLNLTEERDDNEETTQAQSNEKEEEKPSEEKLSSDPEVQTITEEKEATKTEEVIEEQGETVIAHEIPNTTSATDKALKKLQFNAAFKKKGKRTGKISVALRRRKLNEKLSKILTPKSALILLHELKPNCTYKVQEQAGSVPPSFCAQVIYNDEILGAGQGMSKSLAKNSAAENAIKAIVSKTMSRQSLRTVDTNSAEVNDIEMEYTPENLPWAGLASFAIYKMFNEWQAQGSDLLTRSVAKQKSKPTIVNAPTKKNLPPNANELHPAVVLNMVCPGLTAVEVEREEGPKCRVKVAYSVDGKVFTGIGGNKKDAKKEAAKAVLEGFFGLKYPQ